jgi:hypothetical protein
MRWIACVAVALAAAGCANKESPSAVTAPGSPPTAETETLNAGAALLQRKQPLSSLDAYLDGFHFYNGDMQRQLEAHHYCAMTNEDVTQCVIYDGNTSDAKIIGVEYIISSRLFADLPAAEKHFWHSHVHEVRSGQLVAPGIPEVAEHELMKKIAGTYGKTWHLWHTEHKESLPLGTPMLMMGFTQDGQLDERKVSDRDARLGVDSKAKRKSRADIDYPPIDPEADAWQKGVTLQLQTVPHAAGAERR